MSNISVVLTIYGNDGDLDAQLNSLCKQVLKPDEVIIINSLYHHEIDSVLKIYADKLNINYYFSEQRLFPGASRNLGVKMAKYDFIAFLRRDCF